MARKQSKGVCIFCGREMTKGGLSKHLPSCPQRQAAIETAAGKSKASQPLFHLQVQDAYDSDYWLHLEMNGNATLTDLDRYLRGIWLECCGHLSQFSVGGWRGDEIPMSRKISQVFQSGIELTHIYDFGTSSETLVKAMNMRQGLPLSKHPIYLMARNHLPLMACMECDQPATWLCIECQIEDQTPGTLCHKHAKTHPHDNYGEPMEIVNSPRVGMCGYVGPAEPPY